jgi:hypothetical protein
MQNDYAVLTTSHNLLVIMNSPEIPLWAKIIKDWRVRLYGSQPKMEAATFDVLSQTKISRLENGLTHPVTDLNTEEFLALLEAFDWTIEDFEEQTNLEAPPRLKRWVNTANPQQEAAAYRVLLAARQIAAKLQTALGQ